MPSRLFFPIAILSIVSAIAFKKHEDTSNEIKEIAPWNCIDILKILIIINFVALLFCFFSVGYTVIDIIIQQGSILGCVLYIANKYSFSIKNIGITKNDLKVSLNLGLRFGVIVGVLHLTQLYFCSTISQYVTKVFTPFWREIAKEPYIFFLPMALVGIFIAPIAEESLYRGLVYLAFKKKISKNWAMFWSAVIWTLMEERLSLWQVLIGIVLVNVYEKTKSLIPCFVIHGCMNVTWFFSLFYFHYHTKGTITLSPAKTYLVAGSLLLLIFLILQYLAHREKARRDVHTGTVV